MATHDSKGSYLYFLLNAFKSKWRSGQSKWKSGFIQIDILQKPREIQQNASLIVRNLSDLLTWCKHWGPRWSSRSCSRWGWRGGWRRGSRAPSPGSSGRCLPLQNHYQSLNSKCGSNQCRVVHRGDKLCHLFHTFFWILLIWGWNESFIGCPHEMTPDGCQFEEMRAFQTRIWFDSPASVNLKTKFTFYTYLIMHRMQKKYLWGLTMGT